MNVMIITFSTIRGDNTGHLGRPTAIHCYRSNCHRSPLAACMPWAKRGGNLLHYGDTVDSIFNHGAIGFNNTAIGGDHCGNPRCAATTGRHRHGRRGRWQSGASHPPAMGTGRWDLDGDTAPAHLLGMTICGGSCQ